MSLGTRICLSHSPSADEWGELYKMAKKQSLVGVCFAGVQKLQMQRQEPPGCYLCRHGDKYQMIEKITDIDLSDNLQTLDECKQIIAPDDPEGFDKFIGQHVIDEPK